MNKILNVLRANAALPRRSILLLFILAVAASFTVRSIVCHRDIAAMRQAADADFTPFLVESSIMYSYVLDSAYKGGIPEYDPGLAKMEHVKLSEQMPIGLEPFLGWGLKLKNALPGLQQISDPGFVRFQARLWVSLTGGFILLWLLALRVPAGWSLFGALLYAAAPAAVARATGQDLLCEVMALPFLVSAFAWAGWYLRKPKAVYAAAFMVSAFAAVAFWDIVQFVFAVWVLLEVIRSFADKRPRKRRFHLFLLFYIALILAAVLVPYHRAHGMILSPMLLVCFPVLILLNTLKQKRRTAALAALGGLGLLWLILALNSPFAGNYSHFTELVCAKLRHFNIKPKDPSLLTFNARVLWTPALHSATFRDVLQYFPGMLWMTGILLAGGLFNPRFRARLRDFRMLRPLVPAAVFFILFIFLFRFHVVAVIFLSLSCALLFAAWHRLLRRTWQRVLLLALAALTLYAEADSLFRRIRNYESFSLSEIAGLIRYLRDAKVENRVFLSTMELSPMLKAYAGAAIVVQPKFEFPATRQIFKEYTQSLFSPYPEDFTAFCTEHNVDFIAFFRGTGLGPLHPYSYRYMANAKVIPATSAAYLMDVAPLRLKNLYEITIPPKYGADKRFRLFRFVKPADAARSRMTFDLAVDAWNDGNPVLARKLIRAAYLLNPNSEQIYLMYYKISGKIPSPALRDFLEIPK
jgi:hypothetical protein